MWALDIEETMGTVHRMLCISNGVFPHLQMEVSVMVLEEDHQYDLPICNLLCTNRILPLLLYGCSATEAQWGTVPFANSHL